MSYVQISFVGGKPPRQAPDVAVGRLGYSLATYRFPDATEKKSSFFGWALWDWLQARKEKPDRVIVLGTSSSAWPSLLEGLLTTEAFADREDDLIEFGDHWAEAVRKKAEAGRVTLADLEPLAEFVKPDLCLAPRTVPTCVNDIDQHVLMGLLLDNLEVDDRIVLDITHSFRHLPVLASFMLTALRPLLRVRVDRIYYGALEMMRERPCAPVIDLSASANYANLAANVAMFRDTGMFHSLQRTYPEVREVVDRCDFYHNTGQIDRLRAELENLRRAITPAEPYAQRLWKEIESELGTVTSHDVAIGLLRQAKRAQEHCDYPRALSFLLEALLRAAAERSARPKEKAKYDDEDRERAKTYFKNSTPDAKLFHAVRIVRNTLAHHTKHEPGKGRRIKAALESRNGMNTLIRDGIQLAERLIKANTRRPAVYRDDLPDTRHAPETS